MARERKARNDGGSTDIIPSDALKFKLFPDAARVVADSNSVEFVASKVTEYGLEDHVQAVKMAMDVADGGYRQAVGDSYSVMRFDTEIQVEEDGDHLITLPVKEVKEWAGWRRRARKDAVVEKVQEQATAQITEQLQESLKNEAGVLKDVECEVTIDPVGPN